MPQMLHISGYHEACVSARISAGHSRRSIIYHHLPREVRTYGNEPPQPRHNQHPPQEGPTSYQGMCYLRTALRMAQEMGQNVGRGALLL
jgi:hypothetical protein